MNAGAAVAHVRRNVIDDSRPRWMQPHLTQEALGSRLGLNQRRISQLENRPDMKLSQLVAVAEALGVSPLELLARSLAADPANPSVDVETLATLVHRTLAKNESHECPICKALIF